MESEAPEACRFCGFLIDGHKDSECIYPIHRKDFGTSPGLVNPLLERYYMSNGDRVISPALPGLSSISWADNIDAVHPEWLKEGLTRLFPEIHAHPPAVYSDPVEPLNPWCSELIAEPRHQLQSVPGDSREVESLSQMMNVTQNAGDSSDAERLRQMNNIIQNANASGVRRICSKFAAGCYVTNDHKNKWPEGYQWRQFNYEEGQKLDEGSECSEESGSALTLSDMKTLPSFIFSDPEDTSTLSDSTLSLAEGELGNLRLDTDDKNVLDIWVKKATIMSVKFKTSSAMSSAMVRELSSLREKTCSTSSLNDLTLGKQHATTLQYILNEHNYCKQHFFMTASLQNVADNGNHGVRDYQHQYQNKSEQVEEYQPIASICIQSQNKTDDAVPAKDCQFKLTLNNKAEVVDGAKFFCTSVVPPNVQESQRSGVAQGHAIVSDKQNENLSYSDITSKIGVTEPQPVAMEISGSEDWVANIGSLSMYTMRPTDAEQRPVVQQQRCSFCSKNGETDAMVTSHNLYHPETKLVQCPILRAYKCEACNATGDYAHTRTYCPRLRLQQGKVRSATIALKSTRRQANGNLRNTNKMQKFTLTRF